MNVIENKDFLCTKGYGFATEVINAEDPSTDRIELYFDDILLETFDTLEDAVNYALEEY